MCSELRVVIALLLGSCIWSWGHHLSSVEMCCCIVFGAVSLNTFVSFRRLYFKNALDIMIYDNLHTPFGCSNLEFLAWHFYLHCSLCICFGHYDLVQCVCVFWLFEVQIIVFSFLRRLHDHTFKADDFK